MLTRFQVEEAAKAIRVLSTMIDTDYRPARGYDGPYGPDTRNWVSNILSALDKEADKLKAEEEKR